MNTAKMLFDDLRQNINSLNEQIKNESDEKKIKLLNNEIKVTNQLLDNLLKYITFHNVKNANETNDKKDSKKK